MPALSKRTQKQIYLYLALFLFVLFASAPARASMLDLVLKDSPDIFTPFITFNYASGDRSFNARGSAIDYFDGINDLTIDNGTFELCGAIDSADKVAGSLSIRGNLLGVPGSGTLLTAQLTGLGYGSADGVLEFLFKATGGDLASVYGSVGGIILGGAGFKDPDTPLSPQVGTASADIGIPNGYDQPEPVPEPATAALLLGGGIGLALLRRRGNANS
jgi:hypothetical protein